MHHDVIMAGFGGQGILMIGNLLAVAGLKQGLRVTFFPSYGVEMRGGTANCTVTLADREIGSPVTSRPIGVIAMNEPSLTKFGPRVKAGGYVLVNSSLVAKSALPAMADVDALWIPCNEVAQDLGDPRLASMVALGAYVQRARAVQSEFLAEALADVLPEKAHKLIPLNARAIEEGRRLAGG